MDARLKRLLFRSRHRGMKETDRLLGGFVEEHLASLSNHHIDRFEALLDENDVDLFNWITGKDAVPEALDDDLMRRLQDYRKTLLSN